MERYVKQLLEDLEAARLAAPQPWTVLEEDDDELSPGLSRVESIHLAPTRSLEEWTGIAKVALPPETFLSDKHVVRILTALKELLSAFQCHVVFQQNDVPARIQYEVVRQRFHQCIPLVQANEYFFSFCDPGQSQGTCSLGKYCECRFLDKFLESDDPVEDAPFSFPFPDEAEAPEYYLRHKYGEDLYPGGIEDEEDFLDEGGEEEDEE